MKKRKEHMKEGRKEREREERGKEREKKRRNEKKGRKKGKGIDWFLPKICALLSGSLQLSPCVIAKFWSYPPSLEVWNLSFLHWLEQALPLDGALLMLAVILLPKHLFCKCDTCVLLLCLSPWARHICGYLNEDSGTQRLKIFRKNVSILKKGHRFLSK